MYCPTCSTQSVEGAKFCKACGMNLNVVSQALNGGGVVISDPVRDREYKRARRQISEGIQGSAIGSALVVAAGLAYYLFAAKTTYLIALALGLAGIVKLFKSIGSIVDAKMGPKLLDPALQPRSTGSLGSSQPLSSASSGKGSSQRLNSELVKSGAPVPNTRPVSLEGLQTPPAAPPPVSSDQPRIGTGRINREHSSPLRRRDKKDEELMSNLRN